MKLIKIIETMIWAAPIFFLGFFIGALVTGGALVEILDVVHIGGMEQGVVMVHDMDCIREECVQLNKAVENENLSEQREIIKGLYCEEGE